MIEATSNDIGRWVKYTPAPDPGKEEAGRIKSVTESCVFVVYQCDDHCHDNLFLNYTAECTRPELLTWVN